MANKKSNVILSDNRVIFDVTGVVTIYKYIVGDEYVLEREIPFRSKIDRRKKLTAAIKQIRHLSGYFVTVKLK